MTEQTMTTKTRRTIDAALKAKIALEALREQAMVDLLPGSPWPAAGLMDTILKPGLPIVRIP